MILSFGDSGTEDIYHGYDTKKARQVPKDVWARARRKLDRINAAKELRDLDVPPGNRPEPLKGNLAGKYSIRVNEQWRITFKFEEGNASEVKIEDYH